jgi:hypothetical protein
MLEAELSRIESLIPKYDVRREGVSDGSVGWHLAHNLLVINQVIEALQKSDPQQYRWQFSLPRLLVMRLTKRIPRGRARAPKVVQPKETPTPEALREALAQARRNVALLATLDPGKFFPHPFFKDLRRDDTVEFLGLHTRHHLYIIDDILKQ